MTKEEKKKAIIETLKVLYWKHGYELEIEYLLNQLSHLQ